MISRLDQLMRVNREMVKAIPDPDTVPANLYNYMIHYLRINCVVCTIMAVLSGTDEHLTMKDQLWKDLEEVNPVAAKRVESDLLGRVIRMKNEWVLRKGYGVVRALIGFN